MTRTMNEVEASATQVQNDMLSLNQRNLMDMTPKKFVIRDEQVHEKIKSGVNQIADVVVSTLGGKGLYVQYESMDGTPTFTNDGVTAANNVLPLPDPYANQIGQITREAAKKTADIAGDGTTRTIAQIQALVNQLIGNVDNPYDVTKGIKIASDLALDQLQKKKLESTLKRLSYVAYTSSHGDEDVAEKIESIYRSLDRTDIEIEFQKSSKGEDSYKLELGYKFETKSPSITGERVILERPRLILCNFKLSEQGIFDYNISKRSLYDNRPIIFIVKDYHRDMLRVAKERTAQHGVPIYIMKVDTYGDEIRKQFEDISALASDVMYEDDNGNYYVEPNPKVILETLPVERVSTNEGDSPFYELEIPKAILTNTNTYLLFDPQIQEVYVNGLKGLKFEDAVDQWNHDKRVKKLQGQTCVYMVGGNTSSEMEMRYFLIEDAILAVRSAIKEGVVYGAGYSDVQIYKYLMDNMPEFATEEIELGYKAFAEALITPLKIMCKHARKEFDDIYNTYTSTKMLFNFANDIYEPLSETKIYDSVASLREAIVNSKSTISQLLVTNYMII